MGNECEGLVIPRPMGNELVKIEYLRSQNSEKTSNQQRKLHGSTIPPPYFRGYEEPSHRSELWDLPGAPRRDGEPQPGPHPRVQVLPLVPLLLPGKLDPYTSHQRHGKRNSRVEEEICSPEVPPVPCKTDISEKHLFVFGCCPSFSSSRH